MLTVWGKGNSSKLLAAALGCRRNLRRNDAIIRYARVDNPQKFAKEINKASAVRLASQKYESLKVIEAAGVKVPPCSTRLEDLTKDNFSGIILARDYYHSKGSDIIVGKFEHGDLQGQWEDLAGNKLQGRPARNYFIKYLKPRAEYRYHVAFGKVILPTKKILAEGEEDDSIIRNHQGGKWRQVVCTETPRFSESCIKAVEALGLDFGAVDFINVSKEAVILEVNTAPGLEVQNRLDAYVAAFRSEING
jgi:glutathione synthase/RimK-type ligase-like ATP-grasp enzyme